MSKYSLVEFPEQGETNSVAIVPSLWLNVKNKTCYWPPKIGTALQGLVKKGNVKPTSSWTQHSFSRILCNAETFVEAAQKLKKAEETSNLESEVDLESSNAKNRTRRRKTRKAVPSDSSSSDCRESSDDSSLIPPSPPPEVNEHENVKFQLVNVTSQPNQTLTPPDVVTSETSSGNPEYSPGVCNNNATNQNHDGGMQINEKQPGDSDQHPIQLAGGTRSIVELQVGEIDNGSLLDDQIPDYILNDPSMSIATTGDVKSIQNQLQAFAEKVFIIIETHTEQLNEIKAQLHNLRQGNRTAVPDFSLIPTLPLVDRNSLLEFEDWLKVEANYILLVDYLSTCGGQTVEKNTRRVLRKLFGPVLARMINFTGKGEKIALKRLKILNAVKDGVRQANPVASEDTIESASINWFRYSKDRLEGRSNRTNNGASSPANCQ